MLEIDGSRREGRDDFVAAHFPQCDFNNVSQGVAIEDFGDGVSNIEHEHAQAAVRFVRAGAPSIGGQTYALDWCERSID